MGRLWKSQVKRAGHVEKNEDCLPRKACEKRRINQNQNFICLTHKQIIH